MVRRCEAARQRGEPEAGIKHKQRALAVEAIQDETARESTESGGAAVGGDDHRELPGREVEHAHELSAQGHDDHEVQHVRELHARQRQQRDAFAAFGQRVVFRSRHAVFNLDLFSESAPTACAAARPYGGIKINP